jgi:hypothetical protein
MIRYKEEIPEYVSGESARDGLPAALEHKRNADDQPRSIWPESF